MREAVVDEFALREFLIGLLLGAAVAAILTALVLSVLRRTRDGSRSVPSPTVPVAGAPPRPPPPVARRAACRALRARRDHPRTPGRRWPSAARWSTGSPTSRCGCRQGSTGRPSRSSGGPG